MTQCVRIAVVSKEGFVFLNVCVVRPVLYAKEAATVRKRSVRQKNVLVLTRNVSVNPIYAMVVMVRKENARII